MSPEESASRPPRLVGLTLADDFPHTESSEPRAATVVFPYMHNQILGLYQIWKCAEPRPTEGLRIRGPTSDYAVAPLFALTPRRRSRCAHCDSRDQTVALPLLAVAAIVLYGTALLLWLMKNN